MSSRRHADPGTHAILTPPHVPTQAALAAYANLVDEVARGGVPEHDRAAQTLADANRTWADLGRDAESESISRALSKLRTGAAAEMERRLLDD